MRRVIIEEISGYNYTLVDNNDKTYVLNIEFYSKYKPMVNDVIYISEKILEENNLFAFDEIYDTSNINLNDMIKIVHGKDEYYFQRRFG